MFMGRRAIHEVTLADCATSVLFMAGHWFTHPPLWALSVLIPSLIFGLVRDRLQSTYPAIVLHCFYRRGCGEKRSPVPSGLSVDSFLPRRRTNCTMPGNGHLD
jgi:hypothetical protein